IHSMVMSILRQLGVLLPSALILALIFRSVDAVWWCFIVAEFASVGYGSIVYKKLWKNELSLIPEGAE
ncbi:MAG: MATE family efflux transporter, partial [Eubacteriales bacterium]|nr:MATE family efflux transporter [Eubacteriales bacterium]